MEHELLSHFFGHSFIHSSFIPVFPEGMFQTDIRVPFLQSYL